MAKRYAHKMHLHMKKGALHRDLGVPEGEDIPESKLRKAEHSKNPKIRKRAIFAATMKKWHHRGGRRSKRR